MRNTTRDARPTSRAYDDLLQQVSAAPSRRRVWARLEATLEARSRKPFSVRFRVALIGAAVSLACALVAISLKLREPPAALGGFALSNTAGFEAHVAPDETIEVVAGQARLRDHDATLDVEKGTRLRREPRGLLLLAGKLSVNVRHRTSAEKPWHVRVEHGAIEVLGTRFDVDERADGGEVKLYEGTIRFVGVDGRIRMLRPGESYTWPEAPVIVEPMQEPTPREEAAPLPKAKLALPKAPRSEARSPSVHQPSLDVDAVLEHVAELRDRGEYDEALHVLATAIQQSTEALVRERLSYEMGTILGSKLRDWSRACRHLEQHLREFPDGRYTREVTEAQRQLRCKTRL